ncbi:peptidoglycan D,D-transpeptidase FtsI family protein [Burkholderia territorii]|uniref:peptidoglycan D,D-transpeptidase FtsI family protein n=1 Tax=Burkholderia territorii TaxID=1503055 RepID=UPI0009BE3311|nr:penicillin-binding protein 2 [Burkholderia territorii]
MFAAFLVLAGRAFYVQCANSKFFIQQGERRYKHVLERRPDRGRILDRNGAVLAINEPVKDIWVVPKEFARADSAKLAALAKLLDVPEQDLLSKRASQKDFLYLKKRVKNDIGTQISKMQVPGVHETDNSERYYPDGSDFAQLIGLTGADGHGQEGIELAYDVGLTGTSTQRDVIVDRIGNVVQEMKYEKVGAPASDITLTIDRRIQHIAMQATQAAVARFCAAAGSAIVVDARSGEILALANVPTFNPNAESGPYDSRFRNRGISDAFEPGSTIKPVTVSLALSEGVITPNTLFDTSPGVMNAYGRVIHDTSNHGVITTTGIIAKSSNIGMVEIAAKLKAEDMWQNFKAYGVGIKPVGDFTAVARGTLWPARLWKPIEKATMAYGYGLSLSLAQIADIYTVFAGDGKRRPLSIVRGPALPPAVSVVSPTVAEQIRDMLEATVEPGGTATMGRLPDYRVGAKTGTARAAASGRYAAGKYHAVFVGMAPLSAPRLIVAVMIDEPSKGSVYGGPVAGPPFADIMEGSLHLLGVRQDKVPAPCKQCHSSRHA